MYICVVLDDSSRRILAGGEFDAETTENSLWLLREAMDKFGCLASIEQVLTDRGPNSMPTSETRTAMQIADLKSFLKRIKSTTSKLASSILRPMENWKNGMILMNSTVLGSRILTIS